MKKLLLIAVIGLLALTGCEEEADNQAAAAQKCLDDLSANATTSAANACLAQIGSSTDSRVLRVKCALLFIADGINQTDMINAFQALQGPPGTGSPLLNLAVGIAASSTTVANNIVSVCESSGSIALTMIANAAKLGRLGMDAAGGGTQTIGAVAAALGSMSSSEVGEIAISITDTYCAGGKTDEVCDAVNSAYTAGGCAAGDTTCIGNYLKNTCLGNTGCG